MRLLGWIGLVWYDMMVIWSREGGGYKCFGRPQVVLVCETSLFLGLIFVHLLRVDEQDEVLC